MKPIVKSTLMASALSGLLCCGALAQQTPAPAAQPVAQPLQPDFSKVEIKTQKLADDFYVLDGQGGAISVLTGPDGLFLVLRRSDYDSLSEGVG